MMYTRKMEVASRLRIVRVCVLCIPVCIEQRHNCVNISLLTMSARLKILLKHN